MGNASSQTLHGGGGVAGPPGDRRAWANSYPRERERGGGGGAGRGPGGGASAAAAAAAAAAALRHPAHKVLPERVPGQRLRVTDNGAILHNGGTISGRRQPLQQAPSGFRPRSASQHQAQAPGRHGGNGGGGRGGSGIPKRFGSEPDLRCPTRDRCDSPSKQRITSGYGAASRSRKKYKAPAPPPEHDSSSPDSYQWGGGGGGCDTLDPPARRLRLFKTRAETKRSSQQQRRPGGGGGEDDASPAREESPVVPALVAHVQPARGRHRSQPPPAEKEQQRGRGDRGGVNVLVSPKVMQRSLSSPEFQAELIQVAQRIKTPTPDSPTPSPPAAPPTLLPVPSSQPSAERSDRDRERSGRGERETPLGQAALSRSPEPPAAPGTPAPLLPPRRKTNEPPIPPPPRQEKHWEVLPSQKPSSGGRRGEVPARTFYFGMEQGEREAVERFAASLRRRAAEPPRATRGINGTGGSLSSEPEPDDPADDDEDESGLGGGSSGGGGGGGGGGSGAGIALQLRPTLPKKTPEIPRFSPTAAWRLLSSLDAQHGVGANGSQATDEPPVLLEERIQGLSRPVAPAAAAAVAAASLLRPLAAPRSSHDKSGDSGISGDASPGGCADDGAVATVAVTGGGGAGSGAGGVVAWTPQQDLEGEDESSSDGGVDALRAGRQQGPALPVRGLPVQPKYSARAHVFSLSLPRDDRLGLALYADDEDLAAPKSRVLRDMQPSFNSLKKLKRSVSGAFGGNTGHGVGPNPTSAVGGRVDDSPRSGGNSASQALDENWLLSRSAPNLLLHQPAYHGYTPSAGSASTPSAPSPGDPPSFSYLASGGHVMYLPQYELPQETEALAPRGRCYSAGAAGRDYRPGGGLISKSCEDLAAVAEMRQIRRTPSPELPSMLSGPISMGSGGIGSAAAFSAADAGRGGVAALVTNGSGAVGGKPQRSGKGKRFTFQSTVRQIERRRLAERLSKEAELKERQRLSELEAMRQVEEEFQRKRAREKANIRQQLRLFSLDEKLYASLPAEWGDAGARADPEGAPSSSQSSAHSGGGGGGGSAGSGGGGGGGKLPATRQVSASSGVDIKAPSTQVLSEFREPRREYREYRPSRYIDSGPESLPHLEPKRATVHPPAVFDMPKSTQVYVTPHHQRNGDAYHEQGRGGGSTPRSSSSDNYRREFAHGSRPHGRSATSSDSDVSQVNGRPTSRSTSRQTSSGYQPSRQLRSRSASPDLEHTSSSSNMEEGHDVSFKHDLIHPSSSHEQNINPEPVEKLQSAAVDASRFRLTSLQPFVRNTKGYRPIVFNPQTAASHTIAQTVS